MNLCPEILMASGFLWRAFLFVKSWHQHFVLAETVSRWYTRARREHMRNKGIHFRRRMLPPVISKLPHKLMVLTNVILMSPSHSHCAAAPQPTWSECVGKIRNLTHPLLGNYKLKPKDNWLFTSFPWRPPDLSSPTAFDGEGKKEETHEGNQNGMEEEENWNNFDISYGEQLVSPSFPLDSLEDTLHCFTCSQTSFGKLGMLSDHGHDEKGIQSVTAIVDTGASITITPHKDDFESYDKTSGAVLQGVKAGAEIHGQGIVQWQIEVENLVVTLKLRALHVPEARERLLSPQQLAKDHPELLEKASSIGSDCLTIHFKKGDCRCPYNSSNLPQIQMTSRKAIESDFQSLSACVVAEKNQNLTQGQKELLKWHYKFGHMGMRRVQNLLKSGAMGRHPLLNAASRCEVPLCASCAYGKAKRRATKTKTAKDMAEKVLSKEVLIPGARVSMDHFIVTTSGRLFHSRGGESADKKFKGGLIFVDHASGYTHVIPVVNFTAGEAIRAKKEFELEMESMGVTVISYHADNGVFTAQEFQSELVSREQLLSLSGVGAHHQNAMAERAIGVVVNMTRTMLLHARLRWTKMICPSLWPMAMKHAMHILNHMPRENNVCPLDILTKTTVPRTALKELHVWGCPVYVLDPKLQDGDKIPKWNPRSRRALYLGLSPHHAVTVPLVLNLQTGHISPQFHVIFDDLFATVPSGEEEDSKDMSAQEEIWENLLVDDRFFVQFDENDPAELEEEWLTEEERLVRHQKAAARVKGTQVKPQEQDPNLKGPVRKEREQEASHPLLPTQPVLQNEGETTRTTVENTQEREVPREAQDNTRATDSHRPKRDRKPFVPFNIKTTSMKTYLALAGSIMASNGAVAIATEMMGQPQAYKAYLAFDMATTTFDTVDFVSFKAAMHMKVKKGQDPDYPTISQALSGPNADDWMESLFKEIKTLERIGTWTVVTRASVVNQGKKVLPTTWALRIKRKPDGVAYKFKARWCVRGDKQVYGEDYWETFSPVCQWSSVRLMLIMSTIYGLHTRQVDYVNAFAQADLNKDVFVEPPKGFTHLNDEDCVLKLNKSLYGMCDAPVNFFNLLKSNLEAAGFAQMKYIDPCLFVHKKAIIVCYVDDCLAFALDESALDKLIEQMGKKMELTVESKDVTAFLGIQFTRSRGKIEMTQIGLIDKVLKITGMTDCNPSSTPAEQKNLGKDIGGSAFEEDWCYRSVVGMLLYLSSNSRPDITFAVHQAARFSQDPKASHAKAIKRIVRYLQHTKNRGLCFRPKEGFQVDCFVDADFCGLWGSEDPIDPSVAKSRTGYIILVAGCPLLWHSKLQTEVSVSTMMAEYVALSQAMRDMLPLKRLVKTIAKVITGDDEVTVVAKSDVFEDNSGALAVATMPKITPQSKFFAVKLHFFREQVQTEENPSGEVKIQKIHTKDNLADIMTKGLPLALFVPLRDKLMGWDLDQV
jgi:hypothetical protein